MIGTEITGKQFNEIVKDTLYKFTNKSEIHYGYQYVDGLNTDPIEFNISNGECSAGGLYFTSFKYVQTWVNLNTYVREVTIPDDARICMYEKKFKANKIVVGPRIEIVDSDLFIGLQLVMEQNKWQYIIHAPNRCNRMDLLARRENMLCVARCRALVVSDIALATATTIHTTRTG